MCAARPSLRTASEEKRLGAFYTPRDIAKFLVKWAVRSKDDTILDPGFGRGVFLEEGFKRLIELGATPSEAVERIYGIELEPKAYAEALASLESLSGIKPTRLFNVDFFDVKPFDIRFWIPKVHAVVGNPPYVRYHLFKGEVRQKALEAARRAGVELTELTSSWAPYIIHSAQFLRKDGRLAMVVPAELLQVDYAEPVRKWLINNFERVSIIAFDRRVFPGVLEEVVLLLAERLSESKGLKLIKIDDLRQLSSAWSALAEPSERFPSLESEKWTGLLLNDDQLRLLSQLLLHPRVAKLGEVAKVDIGVVTGDNSFFLLSKEDLAQFPVEPQFLRPCISKASHIKGVRFTEEDHRELYESGEKCYLLFVDLDERLLRGYKVWNYLQRGASSEVVKRFKVRTRRPWYSVPSVYAPDAFLSYMSHEVPKLALNEASAVSTNTIHRVMLSKSVDPACFIASFYNTLTLLSAELFGRSYGGGVLKLETKEAERLAIIKADGDFAIQLKQRFSKLDGLIREGEYDRAIQLVDDILLSGYLELGDSELTRLRAAYQELKRRRLIRAKAKGA
jgi:adenine-specific DNA methylase